MNRLGRLPWQRSYVIVFQGLRLQASTSNRIRCFFKSLNSGERFQKFAVTVCVFAVYVWTKAASVQKFLRIQTNPDTRRQGLIVGDKIDWNKFFVFLRGEHQCLSVWFYGNTKLV